MDVIQSRQESRKKKLSQLKKTIQDTFLLDLDVDANKLIYEGCNKWGCSRRTVMEYLRIIQNVLDFEWKNNVIKPKSKTGQEVL